MNDDQVRAFIAAALRTHPAGSDPHRLALVAEELMAQRDARAEDFYAASLTIRELQAEVASLRAAQIATALDGAMFSVWLYGKWRWLTRNMTTEEREAAADAVMREHDRIKVDPDETIDQEGLRWWRY